MTKSKKRNASKGAGKGRGPDHQPFPMAGAIEFVAVNLNDGGRCYFAFMGRDGRHFDGQRCWVAGAEGWPKWRRLRFAQLDGMCEPLKVRASSVHGIVCKIGREIMARDGGPIGRPPTAHLRDRARETVNTDKGGHLS